jgi:hypothetical protein
LAKLLFREYNSPKFHLSNRERWKLEKDDQRGRLARSRDGCIARSGAG